MCVTGRVVGLSRLFILPKQQNLTLTPVLHPTRHFDHVQQIFQWSEFQDSSRKTHFPDFVISKLYFNIIPTGNLFTYFAQKYRAVRSLVFSVFRTNRLQPVPPDKASPPDADSRKKPLLFPPPELCIISIHPDRLSH